MVNMSEIVVCNIPAEILCLTDLSPAEKIVFGRIYSFSSQGHACFLSYEKLAKSLGLTPRSVIRCVNSLLEQGFLKKASANVNNKVLQAVIPHTMTKCHSDKMSQCQNVTVTKCHTDYDKMSQQTMTKCHTKNTYKNTVENTDKENKKESQPEIESVEAEIIPPGEADASLASPTKQRKENCAKEKKCPPTREAAERYAQDYVQNHSRKYPHLLAIDVERLLDDDDVLRKSRRDLCPFRNQEIGGAVIAHQ